MGNCSDKKALATDEKEQTKVLIVVGPSGVGKDSLMQRLFEKYPNSFQKAVTHTSRGRREGEVDGVNYHYVTREEFEDLKSKDGFVETNYYNNNYYGLSKKELEKGKTLSKVMYAIIDINGAYSVHNLNIPANYIAFIPPNIEALEKRLKERGTESEEVIQGRLNTAKEEITRINEADFFNYKILNDDIDRAFAELVDKVKVLYPKYLE